MHISEGVLSAPVLVSGLALTVAATALGLKRLSLEETGRAGILAASFFVASLIHVPLGPSNVHLILNGMVGLLLGWGAFPAILTALTLQAVLFQFGGLAVLGVNTLIMALPAVICYYLVRGALNLRMPLWGAAFAGGALSVLFAALLAALALVLSNGHFLKAASLLVAAHFPVMIIEGIITAFCVSFLNRVQPSLLPFFRKGRPT